jgi:transcriptional regulator with XRE-family HTH domain
VTNASLSPTRLLRLRLLRDAKQDAVARRVGIAQGYLSQLEHGQRIGSPSIRVRLSLLYGVPVGWLFYGEGDDAAYLPVEA